MPTNPPSPEMKLTDLNVEAARAPTVQEAVTEKGPKPGALELAGTIASNMNKPPAELVIARINDILGLTKKDEKGPDLRTDAAVAAKNETPAATSADGGFTDADFAGLATGVKQKIEATPDQQPIRNTDEQNTFILDEERRRKLGIPMGKWQEYKAQETAQVDAKVQQEKRQAEAQIAQEQRNQQAADMMDATRANIDAAGVQRRTEAGDPFPAGLPAAEDQKRRELGMSVDEYKKYVVQVQKEQQSRAESAKQGEETKTMTQEATNAKPPLEVPFKAWTTGDQETDALGQEIAKMQQELQQLQSAPVPADNRAAIASSESSLQHRIDSGIKKWKEMERKAYWKLKNEQPSPTFEGFKLGVRQGQVQFDADGSVKREGAPPVNTGALQQESDRVRASLEGKSEEERNRILAAMHPDVRRVFDIDERRAEAQRKQKLREEQAKQDAMNPDEAQQRRRQEAMAEWLKANPEPTGNPTEHAAWMSKLAAKTAELDAEDLKEAQRRQEIKAQATAAEPENATKPASTEVTATQSESAGQKPETAREAELLKQVAEMSARMSTMEAALAAEKQMREDAMAAIAGNKDLMNKLPGGIRENAKSNPWVTLVSLVTVAALGGVQTIGKMANADSRGRVA